MSNRAAVVIGASAGVGRALAEKLAEAGYRLVVVSRDHHDLEPLAADLTLRRSVDCFALELDLARDDLAPEAFLSECLQRLGRVDAVFFVAGTTDAQDEAGLCGDAAAQAIMRVNYGSAVRVLAAFAAHFEAQRSGRIVGFSSIAAAAPRGRNMVYASAKAGLELYLRALRHYFVGKSVIVQCYALGYVDTAMTVDKKLLFPKAAPRAVANAVLKDLDRDRGLIYFPAFWRWVIWILRRLPWFVYRRLSF